MFIMQSVIVMFGILVYLRNMKASQATTTQGKQLVDVTVGTEVMEKKGNQLVDVSVGTEVSEERRESGGASTGAGAAVVDLESEGGVTSGAGALVEEFGGGSSIEGVDGSDIGAASGGCFTGGDSNGGEVTVDVSPGEVVNVFLHEGQDGDQGPRHYP